MYILTIFMEGVDPVILTLLSKGWTLYLTSWICDYDCSPKKRGLRRVMSDHVYHTFPITVDILLCIFQSFQPCNVFHACMHAAFLVAFFSFLRISNLVPYTLSEVHSSTSFFLRRRDITFTASGAYLKGQRPFSSSKGSWRAPFQLSPTPFCVW